MRGNPQALFGKRPTEKDLTKGTSPAVDFTPWEPRGEIPLGHPTTDRWFPLLIGIVRAGMGQFRVAPG